jgi:hypothetical protein
MAGIAAGRAVSSCSANEGFAGAETANWGADVPEGSLGGGMELDIERERGCSVRDCRL